MKTLLMICLAALILLAACTEAELHEAICSYTSKMSWKEKLFCLVNAPDVISCRHDTNCPPGQHCDTKNTCIKYDLKALYYGCNSPPYTEDTCVNAAINDYKSKNLCAPGTTAHFEKLNCKLNKPFDTSEWDCYISAQCK